MLNHDTNSDIKGVHKKFRKLNQNRNITTFFLSKKEKGLINFWTKFRNLGYSAGTESWKKYRCRSLLFCNTYIHCFFTAEAIYKVVYPKHNYKHLQQGLELRGFCFLKNHVSRKPCIMRTLVPSWKLWKKSCLKELKFCEV